MEHQVSVLILSSFSIEPKTSSLMKSIVRHQLPQPQRRPTHWHTTRYRPIMTVHYTITSLALFLFSSFQWSPLSVCLSVCLGAGTSSLCQVVFDDKCRVCNRVGQLVKVKRNQPIPIYYLLHNTEESSNGTRARTDH